VALAWLLTRQAVAAPVASASRLQQVPALMASLSLRLSAEDLDALDAISSVQ
jgi:aryl-alcohol dehydrogenase-like predicted oxidoreductase